MTAATTTTDTLTIPLNLSREDILAAMEALCGRLADLGEVEECWAIRGTMDEQYPQSGSYRAAVAAGLLTSSEVA